MTNVQDSQIIPFFDDMVKRISRFILGKPFRQEPLSFANQFFKLFREAFVLTELVKDRFMQ